MSSFTHSLRTQVARLTRSLLLPQGARAQAGPVAEAGEASAHTVLHSSDVPAPREAATGEDQSLAGMLLPSDVTHKRFGFFFADTIKVSVLRKQTGSDRY